jgi:Ca2+/Na+ antiporter
MMVLGGISMIGPYSIKDTEPTLMSQDIPVMIGVTVLFIMTLVIFKKIPRVVGGLFAFGYVGYIITLALQSI